MVLTMSPDPTTLVLGVLVVAGVLLSPGRSLLLHRSAAVSRPLASLAFVAAVALIPYALIAAAAQRQGDSPHADLAGYTGATVWALALLGTVSVAALRTRGWQVPALSAAAAATVMGVAGLLWPTIPSSLGRPGGVLALLWAVAVVVVVVTASKDGSLSRARSETT
jgi:peptidoglycan/LPS O-acetylase OafA/YrhL